jgi:hypothetical protein
MITQSISLKQALDSLTGYLNLERNWDSYDADPISALAVSLAQALLLMLDRKHSGQYSNRLFHAAPSPDGGVSLEWKRRRTESSLEEFLEIYVNADGTLEFVSGNEDYRSPDWADGPLEGLKDALDKIYIFLVVENT